MRLRQATSLWIAALMSATGALADVRGVRIPPSFTAQEAEVIGRDPRLVGVAKRCARQLRQAFDALADTSQDSRVGTVVEPCRAASGSPGRASDEGALDILKNPEGCLGAGGRPLGRRRRSPRRIGERLALVHQRGDRSSSIRTRAGSCSMRPGVAPGSYAMRSTASATVPTIGRRRGPACCRVENQPAAAARGHSIS